MESFGSFLDSWVGNSEIGTRNIDMRIIAIKMLVEEPE